MVVVEEEVVVVEVAVCGESTDVCGVLWWR